MEFYYDIIWCRAVQVHNMSSNPYREAKLWGLVCKTLCMQCTRYFGSWDTGMSLFHEFSWLPATFNDVIVVRCHSNACFLFPRILRS
jgi:hypothetical protein